MSIRKNCPCDLDGICPYEAEYHSTCEYYCGVDEPDDYPDAEFYTMEDEDLFDDEIVHD